MYGRAGTVCSLRQAIARIGVHKTRNALLGFSVLRSFRTIHLPPTWSLARFNDHSLATAIFSDLLVQKVTTSDAEWAFLGGLLHDIGLLLIATGLPEEARAISEAESDYQLIERERQVLGFSHFEVGVALLSRWGCPVVVQDASLFCQSNTFQYQSPLSLGMAVKTASLLADMSGMSLFGPRRDEDGAFLLDAISVPKPTAFIDAFQAEYGGLSEDSRVTDDEEPPHECFTITAAKPLTVLSQRAHERVVVKVPGVLRIPEAHNGAYLSTVLDASKMGLRVSSPVAIPAGTRVEVKVLGATVTGTAKYTREIDSEFHVGIEAHAVEDQLQGTQTDDFDLTSLLDRNTPRVGVSLSKPPLLAGSRR